MNYSEEQQSELEALEAIYPVEFSLISDDPATFTISVKSENYDDGEGLCCTLKFVFTPKYPEEVPEVEILENEERKEPVTNLEDIDILDLTELLVQQGNENTGMAMIFTLVSAAIEWLNNRWDGMIKAKEDEEERIRIAEEEAEHQRFEGTRVSVQTFIAWKSTFDEEIAAKRRIEQAKKKEKDPETTKLTGKELFMRDKSMIESDLQFLAEEGDETGPIDESLFEDMEDLDIVDSEGDKSDDE